MIRKSEFLGFVFIGQFTPLFLTNRVGVSIFLIICGLVLLAHIKMLQISIIVNKQHLIIVELICVLSSFLMHLLDFPPTWAAILMSFAVVLILTDWINFKILCKWFEYFVGKFVHQKPNLSEFAVVISNVRQLVFDFKDSRRYALGSETTGFLAKIFESVISFFVHMYRLGKRISRVAHIRRFRLGNTSVDTNKSDWAKFVWLANISLLTLIFSYWIGVI